MATIPFSRVESSQPIAIAAQEVVTRARVVVAAQPTKERRSHLSATQGSTVIPYYPAPVVVEAVSAEHAVYGCEQSFELPEALDPFLRVTHPTIAGLTLISNGFSGEGNVRDGNLATYAERTASNGTIASISYNVIDFAQVMVGFRVVYSLESGPATTLSGRPPVSVAARVRRTAAGLGDVTARAIFELPNSEDPTEFFAFLPPAHANGFSDDVVNDRFGAVDLVVDAAADVDTLRVYELYPLILDRVLVEAVAEAQLRVPAANPRRVTVKGYVAPGDATHTFVGWPGGDFTGVVARQSYSGGSTVIDFGQAGAPPGLSQEAVEAERVRLARTRDLIRSATYPSLIGR